MKKHRTKIIIGILAVAVLAISFLWGGTGNAPTSADPDIAASTDTDMPDSTPVIADTDVAVTPTPEASTPPSDTPEAADSISPSASVTPEVTPDVTQPVTTPSEEASATPSAPSTVESTPPPEAPDTGNTSEVTESGELSCTLTISCATVLDNMDKLREGKETLIPSDGIIFSKTVVFYEGESVFDVLRRELKSSKLHLEYVNAPIYGSAYIEGIGNLYEFDCGERSGWMYSVNGEFPNYGSSKYVLSAGDKIEWLYTCDRGADIGGADAADSYVKD